ncbi:MAG TPA: hypothetical protein VK432_06750 [Stellaceae bacterium]|nr:hypothetical protein [Stellaceae bacterium]
MSSTGSGFAAFRGPADRRVFAPDFVLWRWLDKALRGVWRVVITLPDNRAAGELSPEFFRFPPF